MAATRLAGLRQGQSDASPAFFLENHNNAFYMHLMNHSDLHIMPADAEIKRKTIKIFVVDFYTHVREHRVLGPIFDNKIGDHWEEHFETLTDFWMTVLHGIHSYKGNPFLAHRQTPGMQPEHFDIWLAIFAESAHRTLPIELAEMAVLKSERIASSLRQGLFFRPDQNT